MTLMMGTGIAHNQRPQSTGPSALPGTSLNGVDVSVASVMVSILTRVVGDVILQLGCHEVPIALCHITDAHSLHYDFSISSNRQPRCKVQGQLDGNDFLSYDCDNNVISVNHLREEVNATDFWEEQTGTLKDVGDLLKQELPDIKPEQNTDSVPLTLQVRMMCQREARGRPSGSWEFGFNGQTLLIFDAENTEYTVVHSGGERMKNKWKPNQEVTKAFKTISEGDCSKWLNVLVQKNPAETRGS
ncbi:UL16-binding protein 3-like [Pteropus vampyrus]|uniref:UL16-binding protein 3-like n=1 Tax=Pteropus vampyrus TaxID=132908 RepID=A0A6P6C9N2_PTEVA|nr:UL16-binding protein 3-like [Pteropus vampyrus]